LLRRKQMVQSLWELFWQFFIKLDAIVTQYSIHTLGHLSPIKRKTYIHQNPSAKILLAVLFIRVQHYRSCRQLSLDERLNNLGIHISWILLSNKLLVTVLINLQGFMLYEITQFPKPIPY
jgi:hypothetical protein